MMVGANQIRFGSHEHRSSRAKDAQLYLPKGVKLLPQVLKDAGGDMQNLVATNSVVIDESLTNIKATTESLRNLITAAEQGKGLAGKLFSDEELASNFSMLSSNLVDVSVKLNRGGLWSILWADKNKDDDKPTKLRPTIGPNRR